ncbi:MAG: hypothetical protein U5K76_13715 [Woeseiaceae bacterium]|nr:hypothetical protein [Woeseiaceae bacterium]
MTAEGEFREDLPDRRSSNCACRRCASAATTSCCSPATSWNATAVRWPPRRHRHLLLGYRFPATCELENMLERAVTLCTGGRIGRDDLQVREPGDADAGGTPSAATAAESTSSARP